MLLRCNDGVQYRDFLTLDERMETPWQAHDSLDTPPHFCGIWPCARCRLSASFGPAAGPLPMRGGWRTFESRAEPKGRLRPRPYSCTVSINGGVNPWPLGEHDCCHPGPRGSRCGLKAVTGVPCLLLSDMQEVSGPGVSSAAVIFGGSIMAGGCRVPKEWRCYRG
jgi:hypothetical protein